MAPESTEAAIRQALARGADMIELDVQLTQDHRLVIFHDDRLNRTTDGSGRLTGCPYREIARLDAGSWFSPKFAGMKVLLASQALRLIPSPYLVNLELKRTPHPEILVPALARCLQWTRTIHRVLVSSFEASLVSRMRRTQPRVARALLCRHRPWQALRQALQLGCVALHPHRSLVTRSLVRRAHEQGLHVHVWTADRVRDVRQLNDDDVEGVVTNVVSRLRPICHAGGRPRLRAPFLTSRGRAVAALERGKVRVDSKPMELASLCQDVVDLFILKAQERCQTLSLVAPEGFPSVRADREKIRQVLVNLISNALKFTPEGGAVAVTAELAGETALVQISDTGLGIPEEDQERIFHKFEQGTGVRQRIKGPKGTGLGLAIAKAVVELHGGRIGVRSAPGKGSTFYFTLPAVASEKEAVA